MAEKTTTRTRRPRRNYQEIVSGTIAYCQAAIDTGAGIRSGLDQTTAAVGSLATLDARLDGQMDALRAVLKRLNGTKAEVSE